MFHGLCRGGIGGRVAGGVAVVAGGAAQFPAFGGGDQPVRARCGEVGVTAIAGVEEHGGDRLVDTGGGQVVHGGGHHGGALAHVVVVLGHHRGHDHSEVIGGGLGVVALHPTT